MKILVAIDGSEHCEAAVEALAQQPWPASTEVKVLSVARIRFLSLKIHSW